MQINNAPIPIEKIAILRGLKILPYDLGEDVSGVLFLNKNSNVIGYNPKNSKVRQRFTIAHELGHFEFHKNEEELFVDKGFQIHFRDLNSSSGKIKKEQEANEFAACILMPKKLILKELDNLSFDFTDEKILKKLAQKFEVSILAMTYRLSNLGLI